MKAKKSISLLLVLTMLCSMFISSVPVSAVTTHDCGDAADCLVCEVADMINALPIADDITIDNAATVTNQIHAIDRIKVDLEDAEYDELLTLVDTGDNEAGAGLAVPVRYMEAVETIRELTGGGSLYIQKKFTSADGSEVDVYDAEVQLKMTNIDTGDVYDLTMSTMSYVADSLSADPDFYSMNADEDGWRYKYILPVGTYKIEETGDSGATVNDEETVTTSVTYGGALDSNGIVTLADGATDANIGNVVDVPTKITYNINSDVDGVTMKITRGEEGSYAFEHEITTDGTAAPLELYSTLSYAVTVTAVPDLYTDANGTTVTFTAGGDGTEFNDTKFVLETVSDTEYNLTLDLVEEATSTPLPDGEYIFAARDVTESEENFAQLEGVSLELWQYSEEEYDTLLASNEDNGAATVEGNLVADTEYYLNYRKPGYDSSSVWFTLANMTDYFTESDGVYYVDVAKITTWNFYISDTADNPLNDISVYAAVYADETMQNQISEDALEEAVDEESGNTYWTYTPDEADWVEQFYIDFFTVEDGSGRYYVSGEYIRDKDTYLTAYKYEDYTFAAKTDDGTSIGTMWTTYVWDEFTEEWIGAYQNGSDFVEETMYRVIVCAGDDSGINYKPVGITFTAGSVDDYEFSAGVTGTYEYNEETDEYTVTITDVPVENVEKVEYTVQVVEPAYGATWGTVTFESVDNYAYSQIVEPNFEAATVELVKDMTYTVSVKAAEWGPVLETADYSFTFKAGEEVEGDSVYVFDNDNNTITINVLLEDDAYTPVGDAAVTINFVDRYGEPLNVSGDYGFSHPYEEATNVVMGKFEDTASLTLSELGEGQFTIGISSTAKPEEGYQAMVGWISFYIDADSKLVTANVEDEEGNITAYAPDAMPHIVKEVTTDEAGTTGSIKVEVASFEIEPRITSPGLGYDFPYELYNSDNELVYSDEMAEAADKSGIYLAPGEYTYKIRYAGIDETLAGYVDYPTEEEGDTGVTFKVEYNEGGEGDEVYNVSLVGVYGEIIQFLPEYDPKLLIRYLEPKDAMEVTANVGLSSGTEFNSGAVVSLYLKANKYLERDQLIYSAEIPEGATEFSQTWAVQAHTASLVEIPADDEAVDPMPQVYYDTVPNEYYIVYEDYENGEVDLTATEEEPNIFNAEVAGVGDEGGSGDDDETTYPVTINSNVKHGKIEADVTEAKEGDTVALIVTPDDGYVLKDGSLVVTDENGDTVAIRETRAISSNYYFDMPASTVNVTAEFELDSIFTVTADASITSDADDTREGIDVNAGDTVIVEVIVEGGAFTNADWTLVYDPTKFTLADDGVKLHDSATVVKTNNANELAGQILGANASTSGNEYAENTVVATYTFTAKVQSKDEVEGKFLITSAHANNYTMAGDLNNCPANVQEAVVTILQVKDTDGGDTGEKPSGSIGDTTVPYSGLAQAGEVYDLDDKYANATVTYAANSDGSPVADPSTLTAYRTARPTWTEVGTYYYYVKVSGDGLAEIYDEAILTITPRPVEPTVEFAVDPEVGKNAVTITPVIANVVDNSFKGTVTVTGDTFSETFAASNFRFDGESSAYGAPFTVDAPTSGEFVVNITYTADAIDNYTNGTGSASVDVDKITADETIVSALKATITNEFIYNAEEHFVDVDEAVLSDGWMLDSVTDAFGDTENPSVTNVGDEVLAKVVFKDTNGVYNDVVIYVVLSVTPAKVTVTIGEYEKAMGEGDPNFADKTKIAVELADGTTQSALFGSDDL